MKVLINAVSAKMGGAANYIKNLSRGLAALDQTDEFILFIPKEQAQIINGLASNIHIISIDFGFASFWKRFWFEQIKLRRIIKRERVDVLYSTANFGVFACPCRQVLLVRNSLHFSKFYLKQILPRKGWRARLENGARRWLICQSVKSADVVITPSQAMLDDLRRFVHVPAEKAMVNYYGINLDQFGMPKYRTLSINEPREYRLLYTSLYGEHKNLTTLLHALLNLVENGVCCRLITSADPNWEAARVTCTWEKDAQLAADPRISNHIEFTDVVASEQVAKLYHTADVFTYPSLVESFGHPLVEAMAAGVPIVAGDTAINRELCQQAAVYFNPLDAHDFARQIRRVLEDEALRAELIQKGLQRCNLFRWTEHIERLFEAFGQQGIDHVTLLQGVIE
jgi:glycosyltransferase involved in cell wall biosynthesis